MLKDNVFGINNLKDISDPSWLANWQAKLRNINERINNKNRNNEQKKSIKIKIKLKL